MAATGRSHYDQQGDQEGDARDGTEDVLDPTGLDAQELLQRIHGLQTTPRSKLPL